MEKLRVAVLFGGPSGEYAVSLRSAAAVLFALSHKKYDIYKIGVTQNGDFYLFRGPVAAVLNDTWQTDRQSLLPLLPSPDGFLSLSDPVRRIRPDVVFPVMHGDFGEDGKVQALLSYMHLPFVGCGVAASAIGIDKLLTKRLAEASGVPVLPSVETDGSDLDFVIGRLGLPFFLKPVCGGSSLGASVVREKGDFCGAFERAQQYGRVMAEAYFPAREIEVAVLETDAGLLVSHPGEVVSTSGFYDYRKKYETDEATVSARATLDCNIEERIRDAAKRVFRALTLRGLSRIDFFLSGGDLYLNEINTLPGFTEISLFPKLMKDSFGLTLPTLCDTLIDYARSHP